MAWRERRRNEWISKNGPCKLCGSSENLEVDHIDPSTKAFTIHWAMRQCVLDIELKKCQVLCEKCHFEKSRAEKTIHPEFDGRKAINHGTLGAYHNHRCRCAFCRRAVADYAAEQRKLPHVREKIRAMRKKKHPSPLNNFFLGEAIVIPPVKLGFTHGTKYGFTEKGCRCEACHATYLKYWRDRSAKQPKKEKPVIEIRHGTQRSYGHHRCRCGICVSAQKIRTKEQWDKLKAKRGPLKPHEKAPMVHGTYYCYCHHACRCSECSNAAQIYRDTKKGLRQNDVSP